MFSQIDQTLRQFFSYIFRTIIIFYGLFIILLNNRNYFEWYVYVIAIVCYGVIFIGCKKKFDSPSSRLINDLILISIFLWGKDITNGVNYFLLLLPLINANNHSGDKRGYLTYPCTIIVLFLLQLNGPIKYYLFAPILLIFILDLFSRFRDGFRRINETLFNIVDKFYAKRIGRQQSIEIYEKVINILASSRFTSSLGIESISCFIQKGEELVLVNSSGYILNFEIPQLPGLIQSIDNKTMVEGVEIVIDGNSFKRTFFTKIKGNSRRYVFLIIFSKTKLSFLQVWNIALTKRLILNPLLKHLARIFEIQREFIFARTKNLDSLQASQEYVVKANEVMHFVKNSLSPIKSALTITEMYFSSTNEKIKPYLKEVLIKQRKHALREIQNILERSDFILEKSKNPFESTNIEEIELYNFISSIRRRWVEQIGNNKLIINLVEDIDIRNLKCSIDPDTFYLIVSNILSNIDKYGGGDKRLILEVNEKKLSISFENSLNNNVNLEQLKKIVGYYNDDVRVEIMKRKSHGLLHLKYYIESINATSSLQLLEGKFFIFNLKLSLKS